MAHRFLLTSILLSLVAPQAAASGPGTTQLAGPVVEIPMDLSNEHVGLTVTVNGEGPFAFNLDTYAVTTACVDQRFAERMGLEKVGSVWNGDGSGERRRRDVVLIPELRVGGATFEDVRALVDDYSWVPSAKGGSIDGLLGYHLFKELLLELDYPNERVVLREGALAEDAEHVVSHAALRQQPDFPIQFGDERVVVGIDSGAQAALSLPLSFLDRLSLVDPPSVVGRAQTVYSEAEVLAGVLAEPVVLAGHERWDPTATFSELYGKPLLGTRLLVDYSVTFDQKNGRVRFLKPGTVDAE